MTITHMCTDGGGFQPFSYVLENKSRIILSITLVALIILGSAVLLCSASESDAGGGGTEPVAAVGNVLYDDLQGAINAAPNGGTVVLKRNIDLAKIDGKDWALCVSNISITIDLNGKSINYTPETGSKVYQGLIKTENNAYLVLKDSSDAKNGKVYASDLDHSLVYNSSSCSLIIESGIYHVNNLVDTTGRGMIYTCCNAEESNGNLTGLWIKGGTFILEDVGEDDNGSPWIISASGSNIYEVKITGGTFNDDVQNQYWKYESEVQKEYALRNNGNGTYTIVDAVCYVNVQHKSGKWYTYPYGCESFEEALEKISWYTDDAGKSGGYGNTITMFDDCCINDLEIPKGVEFNLKSEGKLYALSNTDTSGLKVHFIPQDGTTCTLHISSSSYDCKGGHCINAGCGEYLPSVKDHSYDSSITCIEQECEKCGTKTNVSTDHDYEIIGSQKVCSMCGHTVPFTMSGGTEGITSSDNKTTQNSSNQLEVSDIVTGTMVVIAVAILGMIIFDVVRKP